MSGYTIQNIFHLVLRRRPLHPIVLHPTVFYKDL
jgi:hypothetical protein